MKIKLFGKAFSAFIVCGVAAALFAVPAWSQDEDEDAAELGTIEVTGSRLKQTDIETASPVTIISREQIALSGFATVAEVLQTTPYNSFGSFRETSGYANGQAVVNNISLRGLGSARTLVLIDGRRIASTGASGGSAQNLNQIPTSIVERVEILRDGASAIYGSDAIAGVINIITRKDFDGMELSLTSGRPIAGAEYVRANLTGGISNSRGNMYYTVQHYGRQPQYYNQIEYAAHAYNYDYFSSFGYPGSAYVYGNDFGIAGYMVDPRCPEKPVGGAGDDGTNSSSTFPNSYRWAGAAGGNMMGRCGYDFAQDIISIPRVKRNALLLKSNFELTPDIDAHTVLMISQNDSDSRFAGTPITSPYPTMYGDNPHHPLKAYGYDCDANECGTAILLARSVPNGTRDNNVIENIQDLRMGLSGVLDIAGGLEWEANVQVVNNDTDNMTQNLVNKALLQAALDAGTLDLWNVNNTGLDAVATQMRGFNHTKLYQANLKRTQGDIIARLDIGELPGGPVGLVFGVEYAHLSFEQINDPASNALIIAGTAGGDNIQAERAQKTAFFEVGMPILDNLDVSVAGRYDEYSTTGIGSNFSPQITLAYRPIDWVLLRGTYGEGFRAAAMDEMYGNMSESFPSGIDIVGCQTGVSVCTATQYRALYGGNPDLAPEESEHFTIGAVFAPLPGLTLQLGFWHTEYDNLITTSSINREFAAEAAGLINYVYRYQPGEEGPAGSVKYISLQYNNFAGVEAEGLDLDMTYIIDTENAGRFDMGISAAKYTKYIVQTYPESPKDEYQGELGLPDLRINPHVYWGKGDWGAAITGYYLSGQDEDYGGSNYAVGSHMEWNAQVSYQLPWDASITIGALNITNEEPEQNSDWYGWEPFDFTLYSTMGRTAYIRYNQNL
jgi:outer membrane receptor protein involved in Fe transport